MAPFLMVFLAFLTFTGTSLSSPLSKNVLTLPSFNQSDLSALNASAPNLPGGTYTRFPVPGTPITLDVYSYEEEAIPRLRFFAMLSAAGILIQTVAQKYPTKQITSGVWGYQHHYEDGMACTFKVNDFREDGKPLTYTRLWDVIQGLIAFSYEKDLYTTFYYLVDIKDVGLTASGRIDYAKETSTAATVDVT